MKQVLQRLDTGQVELRDVPIPEIGPHQLLVETRATLISVGTERMLVEFGRAGLLGKARSQPDRVRQVLEKVRTDGLRPTLDAVRSKLKDPLPLGYCHAGVVRKVGSAVDEFQIGDRVATNGPHAEWVRVSRTLAAGIPASVPDEAACFVPLAAVALQGIRLAEPTLGETVVVLGLGLVGLLSVQLLRANGCRVIGLDPSPERRALARRFGATVFEAGTDPAAAVLDATGGLGADAVLLTLASKSNEPVNLAAAITRRRGRLVLVGVTGLQLDRDPFFRKELSFTVSCSYGPGRYDPEYESAGQDYPAAYARWTAQRNFGAVLDQMAAGTVDPAPLVTHRIPIAEAGRAYDVITEESASLGVVLSYPEPVAAPEPGSGRTLVRQAASPARSGAPVAGVIGAGNYARRTLLPFLRDAGFQVKTIVSNSGLDASLAADQVGAETVSSEAARVLDDPAIQTVFILTRHDSHAALARRTLQAGKHAFVEKPLALREADVDELESLAAAGPGLLTVGFNRRFAPLTLELARRTSARVGPMSLNCVVNAGALPGDHWTQSADVGGGRIVGEACHFMDLGRRLAGAPIADLSVSVAFDRHERRVEDVAHLSLRFADGSIATIAYLANGARAYPKETITCFFDGATAVIENWCRLRVFGRPGPPLRWPRRMDKGHGAEMSRWAEAIRTGEPPIPYDELFDVSRWAIRAGEAVRASPCPRTGAEAS